jgi:hypothetical protein
MISGVQLKESDCLADFLYSNHISQRRRRSNTWICLSVAMATASWLSLQNLPGVRGYKSHVYLLGTSVISARSFYIASSDSSQ